MRSLTILLLLALWVVAALGQTPCDQQHLSIEQLEASAARGDAQAQVGLARAYTNGCGLPQNSELAFTWVKAAAEQGDAAGQNELGNFYRSGQGTVKAPLAAVQWYRKAARQGFAAAMFNATAYYNGDGVPVDDQQAYAWMLA